MKKPLDTHQRALAVNLDPTSYGTLAEIGAGQEVARWFLQVGGAAGTVAKTISAYDMAFSDAIYGKASRYVSRERLLEMLDHEYPLLPARLGRERGARSRFFAFADTVSARNYAGTNECHGWMGLRFQHRPRARASDILLHVNLRDATNLRQQEALGILGVNLVYTAFLASGTGARLLASLFEGLSLARVELDHVELAGPAFRAHDARTLGVELVRSGLAPAVVLTPRGELAPPTEFLRKRPLVIEREGLRAPASRAGRALSETARELARRLPTLERPPLPLLELALPGGPGERVPPAAVLARRSAELGARGFPVLLTRGLSGPELGTYLRRYTKEPVVLAARVAKLVELLQAGADQERAGGALEALGKVLGREIRTYVAAQPAAEFRADLRRAGLDARRVRAARGGPVRIDELGLPEPLDHLLAYLLAAGWVVPLGGGRGSDPRVARGRSAGRPGRRRRRSASVARA